MNAFSARQKQSMYATFDRSARMKAQCSSAASNKSNAGERERDIMARKIILAAPKNGAVSKLLKSDGALIKAGETVCELERDDETYTASKLTTFNELLALEEELLTDGNVKQQRELLKIALDIAQAYKNYADQKLAWMKAGEAIGNGLTLLDVGQAAAALAKAIGEVRKAEINLDNFDFSVDQARKRLALLRRRIPDETQFLHAKIERLTIVSPVAGKLTYYVGVKSFIKLGDPIGEVLVA
jgi:multidrug efflux pump subunit AcrA (membrane-fusion protein)